MLHINSTIKLLSGQQIPVIGLGVYMMLKGRDTFNAVTSALKAGYRHIDTAKIYGNEADVGRAILQSGLPRESVFVTTKLWNADQGFESTRKAFEESLMTLGLDYVDLYLIHWPLAEKRLDSWKALIEIQKSKRSRSIGVSNFTIPHLEELISKSGVIPSVNQVEFSPFLFQKELLEYCQIKGIAVEAYSPLTRGKKFGHPTLTEISQTTRKSPAQILIRWALQHGLVVIPKSRAEGRIRENISVFDFELSQPQMDQLDRLDEGFRVSWNPEEAD